MPARSQDFYDINTIQKIEITFSQSNWDYILDTAKAGTDSYLMAQEVKINGTSFDSVGVKYKGNSSYNATRNKNPFHIEMDHFADREYLGYRDIKLSNGYNEPSNIREALLYGMLQNYTWASRANFAQVYVNGQEMGLYTNVEAVTKTFLKDRFGNKKYSFIFADQGGCNLVYRGSDTTLYYSPYTLKSDYGYTDLMRLCDTLRNNTPNIETNLNIDRTLWMHAFNNVTVTLDSYAGNGTHNYYLYEDKSSRFNPIHWDLNGGLGIFARPYSGPSWTISQLQNMSIQLHMQDTAWPLIQKILNVPLYYRMYIAHARTLLNENFLNNSYYNTGLQLQSIIDTAVASDPNQFFPYSDYQANLTTDVTAGTRTFPGITSLMNTRMSYLSGQPDFLAAPPQFQSLQLSSTAPLQNSMVTFYATVSNATSVYIGTRNDWEDRFYRVPMYDDGTNGDVQAGDGIWSWTTVMDAFEKQYFFYADNATAGMFSPERAEHEYYTLQAGTDAGVQFNLFPNPASSMTSVILPSEGYEFQLYDVLGRRVARESLSTGTNTLILDLSAGVYMYRFLLNGNPTSSEGILLISQ